MRAANAANRRKVTPAETPEALALRLIDAAHLYAAIWNLPVTITPDHLLPWPEVCVYTLDDLIKGDNPQQPTLARLVDSEGFTPENTVIISARARRRHQAIGGTAIRKHVEKADRLPGLTEHLVRDALERHNRLTWPDDAARIAEAWDFPETPKIPAAYLAVDEAKAPTHWREMIDRNPADWIVSPEVPPESRLFLGRRRAPEDWPDDWLSWANAGSICVSLTDSRCA
jgi:hypothetical protein